MAKPAEEKDTAEKPKGGMMKMVIGAVLLLCVGAGGAYGAVAAGLLGGDEASGPDLPEFVRKGESEPYALPESSSGDDGAPVVHGDGGSEYRTAYYSFDETFTSNLADSPGLIQVDIAVSTRRDGRVLLWVQTHELAIRSAILAQLAATPEGPIYTVEGKEELSTRLTRAINEVLEENEGFGGIDAVHFRGFLVQ